MSDTVSAAAPNNPESFASLIRELEDNRDIREGAVLEAMVVEIDGNRVSLDAGLKSLSIIPLEEFRDDSGALTIELNDFVKVKVELLDDGRGNTRLSHLQYRRAMAWEKLLQAYENSETIEGVIRERVKGGYSVHINGLRAFLPGSLVDLFPTKREDPALIGRVETFHVERIKQNSMSAILNRRLVRERELAGCDLDNISINVGDKFTGKVVATVDYPDYTAFVHIGAGVHGRLHRNELSWHRVGNISEALEIDQEMEVVVLEIDRENKIINLGAKQLLEDPWNLLETSYPVGTHIFGKVTLIKEYGAFVEIEKGIEGLVHTSEMDWLQRNVSPANYLKVGDEIEVMMLECNKETRRISLSLKQCKPNPWDEFNVSYRNGSKLTGKVSSRTENLGLFVDLPGGLTGLVHISNLSYTDNWKEEMLKYEVGQEIDVFLMAVDLKAQRISLGIKQLGADPLDLYQEKLNNNEPVAATVVKLLDKMARLRFDDGMEAMLPIGEVSDEHIATFSVVMKVGDKFDVLITNVEKRKVADSERRRIFVSKKAVGKADRQADVRKLKRDPNAKLAEETKRASSFGAMFNETMGMEEDEAAAAAAAAAAPVAAPEVTPPKKDMPPPAAPPPDGKSADSEQS